MFDSAAQTPACDLYAFKVRLEPECHRLGLSLPFVEHPQGGTRRGKPTQGISLGAPGEGRETDGLWMPGSLRELENAILDGRIRLRRNPVLMGAFMSAVTDEDRWGNRWLATERSLNKIDPAVALCMVLSAAAGGSGPMVPDVMAMIALRGRAASVVRCAEGSVEVTDHVELAGMPQPLTAVAAAPPLWPSDGRSVPPDIQLICPTWDEFAFARQHLAHSWHLGTASR